MISQDTNGQNSDENSMKQLEGDEPIEIDESNWKLL